MQLGAHVVRRDDAESTHQLQIPTCSFGEMLAICLGSDIRLVTGSTWALQGLGRLCWTSARSLICLSRTTWRLYERRRAVVEFRLEDFRQSRLQASRHRSQKGSFTDSPSLVITLMILAGGGACAGDDADGDDANAAA